MPDTHQLHSDAATLEEKIWFQERKFYGSSHTHTGTEQLIAAFASIEAVELKGLELLRRLQPASSWLPDNTDAKALAEAATELMDYMEDCEALARKVCGLKPIPLSVSLPEYGL